MQSNRRLLNVFATMQIWLGKQYLGQTDKPISETAEDFDPEELSRGILSALLQASLRKAGVESPTQTD